MCFLWRIHRIQTALALHTVALFARLSGQPDDCRQAA